MTRLYPFFLSVLLAMSFSCSKETTESKFIEAQNTGITFSNELTNTPQLNILNYLYFYNGAGTAVADFNNDGLLDIYFTGNQVADQLYLNQGDLKFIDITDKAAIYTAADSWNTGVTTVDINADGLLDIYVCTVSGHLDLTGSNKLYINQGVHGTVPMFIESAAAYGLDYSGLSTQASFFDYDKDGDLDMYLLNHSVHPNASYGRAAIRKIPDPQGGDKLYRNDGNKFTDVTEQAGIFNSKIGYGLGVSISDLNNDGYPDIYVANDFFENDYVYINNQDGTFSEANTTQNLLGHTSHFSMGSDIADLNNDGNTDILSLDMLPENLEVLKASGNEYAYPIYQNQLRNGYDYQFMQNTLQLNLGNGRFAETAFQSGVAATEWSWSPLMADLDNDGYKDIYIANGILGATNDMDFVNFISNENIQKRLGKNMSETEMEFINKLPEIKATNYAYRNDGNGIFEDVTAQWTSNEKTFSNGATYGDLDNDGDLDLVVNNVNQPASILKNTTIETPQRSNGITVHLIGTEPNTFGIGAKITAFTPNHTQIFENYNTRGFMSAVAPSIFVGLGNATQLDSLKVLWPSGKSQVITNVKTELFLDEKDASQTAFKTQAPSDLVWVQDSTAINFQHKDGNSIEFSRDPLVPYANTNTGPAIETGDLNNDGLDDILILGAKAQQTSIFFQQENGNFTEDFLPESEEDAINEDTAATLIDVNNDGLLDIVIASGGNEFTSGRQLTPRLYLNSLEGFAKVNKAFEGVTLNASAITAIDFDNDSHIDLAITSDLVPQQFGATPQQFLLKNDGKGNFTDVTSNYAPDFSSAGNVKDMIWVDLDHNGFKDAIVCGHWMPVKIFMNSGEKLRLLNSDDLKNTNGLWNSIRAEDFDGDGDMDLIAGNWGLNTRLTASVEKPLNLYRFDFDNNGKIDPITTYFYKGTETVLATKDELVKQLPFLNKKFLSYHDFAKAGITDLLSEEKLDKAGKKQVFTLETTYFENQGNLAFKATALPQMAQISSVKSIITEDFNSDGLLDILLLGNDSEISTQLGRLDASHGVFLLNTGSGFNYTGNHTIDIRGAVRSNSKLKIKDDLFYIIGRNNDKPLFIRKETAHD